MQRDNEVYVGHMLDLSRKVASKTAGVRREDFDRDENLRLALAHLLQTIGEAARRVSRKYQKAHPEIPWGGIVGLRFVSLRVGWLTIQRDTAGYSASWVRPRLVDLLGLHVALPDGSRMLRVRTAAWAAAGPLTTLLVALACRAHGSSRSREPEGPPRFGSETNGPSSGFGPFSPSNASDDTESRTWMRRR